MASNPRATANRRVMNKVHAHLSALQRDMTAGRINENPFILNVVNQCLKTLDAGMVTDARHQREEGASTGRLSTADIEHELSDHHTTLLVTELRALRRLADLHHSRLLKLEDPGAH